VYDSSYIVTTYLLARRQVSAPVGAMGAANNRPSHVVAVAGPCRLRNHDNYLVKYE